MAVPVTAGTGSADGGTGDGDARANVAKARKPRSRRARRFGYLVAVTVNIAALWVVNQFLDWGWPPFLTGDFRDLLPILDVSFVAGVVVNLVWMASDPPWLRHAGQIGLDAVGLAVLVRTWQVFPFDLSDYSPVWETVARVAIVACIVLTVIATIVETVRLVRAAGRTSRDRRGTPSAPASSPHPGIRR